MSIIYLQKAVLHIVDTGIDESVLSDELLETTGELDELLCAHLERLFSDSELKVSKISSSQNELLQLMTRVNDEDFLQTSKEICRRFFSIIKSNSDIPDADLIIMLVKKDEERYLAVLKLNYKLSYIHRVAVNNGHIETGITIQRTALPNEKQKVDECILINLVNGTISIKEKKYEVNGVKEFYLSKMLLEIKPDLSPKEKYNVVEKAAKKLIKEYFDDDIAKEAEVKGAILDSVCEGKLDIKSLTKRAFENDVNLQEKYKESIESEGVTDHELPLNEDLKRKINKKQRIKTASGIEINIPSDLVNDSDKIEFIMNDDGTMSLLIKRFNEML